jgi:hypothetical protein
MLMQPNFLVLSHCKWEFMVVVVAVYKRSVP